MTTVRLNSRSNPRPWFLNPGVLFYGSWLGVWALYSLRLSRLLLFGAKTLQKVELPILAGFLPLFVFTYLLPHRATSAISAESPMAFRILDQRLRKWFIVWVVSTIIEIIVSGGVPLLWTLRGSSKTYFDFGIPTMHGILNALIFTISIIRFAMGLKVGRKKDLLFPLILVAWATIVEARQLIMVLALECACLFLMYRRLRLKRFLGGISAVLLLIVLFGISGDIRSGGEAFQVLAQPTDRYPTWLPSGFLWAYIYMTTPLNNLVNTWVNTQPIYDLTMPNTTAQLIPTAVRKLLGQKEDNSSWKGDLVAEAFNVSTAYVGPYQDMGVWGVLSFSGLASLLAGLFWQKRGMHNDLIFAVFAQCVFLSIFFNHFFYLPIIAQIAWVYLFFSKLNNSSTRVIDSRV